MLGFATEEDLLTSLEADLRLVPSVRVVDRQRDDWAHLTAALPEAGDIAYPFIFINDARSTYDAQILCNLFRKRLTVFLVCGVEVQSDDDNDLTKVRGQLDTALNAFLRGVVGVIHSNTHRTLAGRDLAYRSQVVGVNKDGGYLFPQAVAIINVEMTFFDKQ